MVRTGIPSCRRSGPVCVVACLSAVAWHAPLAAQDGEPWGTDQALYATDPPAGSRQFDFLIGDWDVVGREYDIYSDEVESEVRVELHAEYANDGRMVVEDWTAYSPATGRKVGHRISLRTYSEETGEWQHVYLRSHQTQAVVGLTGEWHPETGEMIERGNGLRIRFFDITADSFEWEQTVRVNLGGSERFLRERTQSARRRSR